MSNTLLERIERLNEIGIALSAERNPPRLLETIVMGAKSITNADGGTLYLVHDGHVRMEIVRTDSLEYAMGGTTEEPVPFPPIPLYDPDGQPNTRMVVTYAVHSGKTVNIADAYDAAGFDFSGTRQFDHKTGYRSRSFLTVPMKNHEGDIIGVLQLINARGKDGSTVPFGAEAERFAESLASQAAIALTNQRLIGELHRLFEALTRLIADAVDEKSPYTGGHCRRVADLTLMLADAAAKSERGPLKGFVLDEAGRYELETAAWLHDCGKITTPEHVVDKATKLEGVFDRIELVDYRFALLKREAEIAALRRRLAALEAGDASVAGQDAGLQATLAELDEEREFVRRCNLGREFMPPQEQERVRRLAQRTLTVDGGTMPLLTDDEVHHLTVSRGTLTPEERQVINNHVAASVRMLEALPFPKHLRRVPEFAGGHHERMDGKGYPRGLKGEEMSVQARIMAIADIFEALTAKDRPYKPAKKLSEALAILQRMKDDGHIDPDLLEVFLEQRVHLAYARAYLDPEQIDLPVV